MLAAGIPEVFLFSVLSTVLTLVVAYYVIKAAVRNGTYEAHRRLEREGVRSGLGVGEERRPGQLD